jgi:hypothetical protein
MEKFAELVIIGPSTWKKINLLLSVARIYYSILRFFWMFNFKKLFQLGTKLLVSTQKQKAAVLNILSIKQRKFGLFLKKILK